MPQNNAHGYEFGSYRFDVGQRVLTRAGEAVSLTPKATDLLTLLVTNAGQLVSREELVKQVWPDTFVEESNLTQNVFLLRQILGDDRPSPKYIETVVRRGYRFIASVRVTGAGDLETAVPSSTGSTGANGEQISPSLAVLPFINASGNPDIEYLAEGLTENIANNLSTISKLRVMSRSAVFRYKKKELDPRVIGKELDVIAVLVGKLTTRPQGLGISVELVEVASGWQLWGHSFDCERQDIIEIQDTITRQLLSALKLKLTGDEEKRVTARYTESAEAYKSYLEARYHWSQYTRAGIEKAIGHFRNAIELDPNYALAYAGIIDCYLRLTTNYLPPDQNGITQSEPTRQQDGSDKKKARGKKKQQHNHADPRIKLRFEWDCKGAERELNRANELKSDYPSAHQWYAAYHLAAQIFEGSSSVTAESHKHKIAPDASLFSAPVASQIDTLNLTPNEQVQIHCTIAREQIDVGNYEAAFLILKDRWKFGDWPKLNGLNLQRCADLLFTVGQLAGWLASTRQLPNGQQHGSELLSGSIAFCEQLGLSRRAAEGRIELALCYYRQGLFDHSRSTLLTGLRTLSTEDAELRALALIRLAGIERDAGRLNEAFRCLSEASDIGNRSGPWVTGRCHIELASTYKELAIAEENPGHFEEAKEYYRTALYQFEAVGNHRLAASTQNNLGFMLLYAGDLSDAESHLSRARRAFDSFGDQIRRAQVDDSLAHLHLAQGKLEQAEEAINRAVEVTEKGDEDLLLAEGLTTKGLIYAKLGRIADARRVLEDAHRLAFRCGDQEGAGRALLVLIEEVGEAVGHEERQRLGDRLVALLTSSERPVLRQRLQQCLEIIRYTKAD